MNNSEKVELILIFGECNCSSRQAIQVYVNRYSDKYHPPHNYVHRLLHGLNENGEFLGNRNEIPRQQPRV